MNATIHPKTFFPWQQSHDLHPIPKEIAKKHVKLDVLEINHWSQKVSVFGGCFSSPEAIRTFAASFSFAFLASQLESVPKQTPGAVPATSHAPHARSVEIHLLQVLQKYQPKPREMECRPFGCGTIFPNMPPVYKQGFRYNYTYSGVATCLSFWPNGAPWTKKSKLPKLEFSIVFWFFLDVLAHTCWWFRKLARPVEVGDHQILKHQQYEPLSQTV